MRQDRSLGITEPYSPWFPNHRSGFIFLTTSTLSFCPRSHLRQRLGLLLLHGSSGRCPTAAVCSSADERIPPLTTAPRAWAERAQVQLGMQEAVRRLGPLLEAAVTRQGMVHEVSSIVSDPGSPRQCVHADTIYMPCRQYPVHMAPLYTFFIALQVRTTHVRPSPALAGTWQRCAVCDSERVWAYTLDRDGHGRARSSIIVLTKDCTRCLPIWRCFAANAVSPVAFRGFCEHNVSNSADVVPSFARTVIMEQRGREPGVAGHR
jgi:hypothetical protein